MPKIYKVMPISAFWSNTKALIKQRNKTQRGLSLELGLSERTLEQWILRDSIPSADTAVNLAKALDTTVEYLVTGVQPDDTSASRLKAEVQAVLDRY